jgi:serine protease Do
MEVGEFVMAIGNPFGLDHTVTVGVLSAKNRAGLQGNSHFEDFLQTDAQINPGNSGGPLVNVNGEVIGINTMIVGGTGIGFAVPSSMARPIVDQLIQTGHVRRPYIGISMQELTPELSRGLGKGAPEKGALVGQVQQGTPAEQAGAKAGDVITAVNGQPVTDSRGVQKDVLGSKIGDKVDLTVWRDGKTLHLYPVTKELPGDRRVAENDNGGSGPEHTRGKLGLALSSLTPNIAEQLGIDARSKGAVVTSVREGSPAQEAGLQQGDIIVEVDRRPVTSADDAVSALSSKKAPVHLVRVRRGDAALFLTLPAA